MVEKDTTKYPARLGARWDDDEVRKLLTSIQKKKPILEIAIEHQRTTGAINAEMKKLAADYWFNDKRPIEEIIKFTGLTKEEIEYTIKRRTATMDTEFPIAPPPPPVAHRTDNSENMLTFGKYNGKSYDFVKQSDVSYCNWVLKQISVSGRMLHFQQWLKTTSKKVTCECCNGTGLVDAV